MENKVISLSKLSMWALQGWNFPRGEREKERGKKPKETRAGGHTKKGELGVSVWLFRCCGHYAV